MSRAPTTSSLEELIALRDAAELRFKAEGELYNAACDALRASHYSKPENLSGGNAPQRFFAAPKTQAHLDALAELTALQDAITARVLAQGGDAAALNAALNASPKNADPAAPEWYVFCARARTRI